MTVLVTLQALPNQTITITLENSRYELTFKTSNGIMAVDLSRDNVRLMSGARVVAGTPLLAYDYQATGNFIFVTDNDGLPDWQQFGSQHQLVYLTQSEIAGVRGG